MKSHGLKAAAILSGVVVASMSVGVIASVSGWADSPVLTVEKVQNYLERIGKGSPGLLTPLPRGHPDSPAQTVLQTLSSEAQHQSEQVIQQLESLREQGMVRSGDEKGLPAQESGTQEGGDRKSLWVGPLGSFRLWRELSYLLLGRAYYSKGRMKEAEEHFRGLPKDSIFYPMAREGLIWALLSKNDLDTARDVLKEGRADHEKNKQKIFDEIEAVQLAFLLSREGKFEGAMKILRPLVEELRAGKSGLPERVQVTGLKIFAESSYRFWIENFSKLSFQEKIQILQPVVEISQRLRKEGCDSDCASFVAEAHWNLASTYRVEDPVKYESSWKSHLREASQWLHPWVDASLKKRTAHLTEDAFFLAVSALWEQGETQRAVVALEVFPDLYRQGRYLQDVYLFLGDHAFEQGNYQKALTHYRKLVDIGEEEKSSYGMYKSAWSFYNLQKRWEALRHLERLLIYYRVPAQGSSVSTQSVGILREANRDVLLFMAELLGARDATKELEAFKLSPAERITVMSDLALTYKQIGRFEEAGFLLQDLLAGMGESEVRGFQWLSEWLDSDLRLGRYERIVGNLRKYFPKLTAADLPGKQKSHELESLEQSLGTLVLTLHREARKTDDPKIWAAVDPLYEEFGKGFPHSEYAAVWYFGAQRLEQRRQIQQAMLLYQKAAEIHSFVNREDAAVHLLRLTKDAVDQLSLGESKEAVVKYETYANQALWFVSNFEKLPQKKVAETIYLESLCEMGKVEAALDYLKRIFKKEGFTPTNQNQVRSLNAKFYREKKWTTSYFLSSTVLSVPVTEAQKVSPDVLKFRTNLRVVLQETAFQTAFESKQVKDAREWYLRSFSDQEGSEGSEGQDIRIRAWHNLLLSFQIPDESPELIERYESFLVQKWAASARNEEWTKLRAAIDLQVSKAYESMGDEVRKADLSVSSLQFHSDPTQVDSLSWGALATYAKYHETEKFLSYWTKLHEQKSRLFLKSSIRLQGARFLFHLKGSLKGSNGSSGSNEAWRELRSILGDDPKSLDGQLLLRDLFFRSGRNEKGLHAEISDWILKHQEVLLKQPVLLALWPELLTPRFDFQQLAEWNPILHPSVGDEKGVSEVIKDRLQRVKRILSHLSQKQEKVDLFLKHPAVLVRASSHCVLPVLRRAAIRDLAQLREGNFKDPRWDAFQKRLDKELSSFEVERKKETRACDQQQELLDYFPRLGQQGSDVRTDTRTLTLTPPEKIQRIAKKIRSGRLTSEEAVSLYLEDGAFLAAEAVAGSVVHEEERAFLLAQIRLAYDDIPNAASLLKVLSESESAGDPSASWRARAARQLKEIRSLRK